MNDIKQVAIYARVSTVGAGQDPEMQTRELREYCERRGWTVVGEYVDRGISGAKDSRPQLDRLMEEAHKRSFSGVVVWKFDRFARSVSHLLRALETFRALGIEFVSLTEQVDTTTPMGKMIFTVLGSVAELERGLVVERVRAGMRNARAKGKLIGRPPLRKFSKTDNSQFSTRQPSTRLAGFWQGGMRPLKTSSFFEGENTIGTDVAFQ
jgi:DNA invertase Pin-like site-specific DNA recombinase